MAAARRMCPFPTEPVHHPFTWPDSPSAFVAGWYRRSDRHAPAPAGVRELVQVAGEGFGPADHPTTALCLAALDRLSSVAAVDVGCGSGLLTQAWARRWGAAVLAIDLDPAAAAQTRTSLLVAGCADLVEVRHQPIQALCGDDLRDRVVFANISAPVHRLLLQRIVDPPSVVVVSGIRPNEAPTLVAAYTALGLRRIQASRHRRYECHVLVRRP